MSQCLTPKNENYDLIITITSDSMVPATHRLKKTPWLFTNVNNPSFFGISNVLIPGNNKSGTTYYVPVIKQLVFFNKIMNGKLKKIGLIFDYDAKSRRAELIEFREAALSLGIDYILKLVKNKNELPSVAKLIIIFFPSGENLGANVIPGKSPTTS